jgi:hypothetical protein
MAKNPINKDKECSISITGRVSLVAPAYPDECSYVRVVDSHNGEELAYWDHKEWEEDPTDVMGAIIGLLNEAQMAEIDGRPMDVP